MTMFIRLINMFRNVLILSTCFIFSSHFARAEQAIGQVLQINTHFSHIQGSPTWLIILRDVETQVVSPYLYDVQKRNNFWIAFTPGHTYKITVSQLRFGQHKVVTNYCHLENGVLIGKSKFIVVTGSLTPDRSTSHCSVTTYEDTPFPVVND